MIDVIKVTLNVYSINQEYHNLMLKACDPCMVTVSF